MKRVSQAEILHWALQGVQRSLDIINAPRQVEEYTALKKTLTDLYIEESIKEVSAETHPFYSGYIQPMSSEEYEEVTSGYDWDVFEDGFGIVAFRLK